MSRIKFIICCITCALITTISAAQNGEVSGLVVDGSSGETIIGATVIYEVGKGVTTDIDGRFKMSVPNGDYKLQIQFVGYKPYTQDITVKDDKLYINVKLNSLTLQEVDIVADIAISRETPVAFSNISPVKIREELASQDIPLILNSTPGIYATEQGGGTGDARVTIRGFNQRNIAVMIDGIPQNDMENGWVYWSNWFGLDNATKTIQVQRGLGASKLAIPSVGGSINILTKDIGQKPEYILQQEIGTNNFQRTTLTVNSGKLKNGWGFLAAGSFRQGDGFVDQAYDKMFFYFFKLQKQMGNHTLTATAFGAPQEHAQRSFKKPIAYYDNEYAKELGIVDSTTIERGYEHNEFWGYLRRYREASDSSSAGVEVLNERLNYFHKPVFSIKDFWKVSDKVYISNVAYASLGRGGGTSTGPSSSAVPLNATTGQFDFQTAYNNNAYSPSNVFMGERRSSAILQSSVNNHDWYGFLSTVSITANDNTSFSGGVDLRTYKGEHYREVYDLLGGDLYLDTRGSALEKFPRVKREGDKIDFHNDSKVRWGGAFALMEFKGGNWSAFVNLSGSRTGYQRVDYFRKKDLELSDTLYVEALGYGDTVVHNGIAYHQNSSEARFATSEWKWINGYTVKGGFNYNLTEKINVFTNIGYLSKAQRFDKVIDFGNKLIRDDENEEVRAVELGASYHSKKFTTNLNTYYTTWTNKPLDRLVSVQIDDESFAANVNGISARHMGAEIDFAYRVLHNLTLEGMISLGDWIWTSKDTVFVRDDDGNLLQKFAYDADGIHVGDAAQKTYGASVRFEPIRRLWIKGQFTYFTDNYADFSPETLKGADAGRESWKMPSYYIVNVHAGYGFKLNKLLFNFRVSVLNAINDRYIIDARNNDTFVQNNNDFDAASASVFFGLGRRYTSSLRITF